MSVPFAPDPSLQHRIVSALDKSRTLGLTPKQLGLQLQENEEAINYQISLLKDRGKVGRVGRNFWILNKYRSMNADPLFVPPSHYTAEFKKQFNVPMKEYSVKVTFSENLSKRVHRWSPYVQGFSAEFVEDILSEYAIPRGARILDPFSGSGTVPVAAKMLGINSIGVDMMPLMPFVARIKTDWSITPADVVRELQVLRTYGSAEPMLQAPFLRETKAQFTEHNLKDLLRIKQFVLDAISRDKKVGNFLKLAFISILIPSSNLKRAPSLGYTKKKVMPSPFTIYRQKVKQMLSDLQWVQKNIPSPGKAVIREEDAKSAKYDPSSLDMAITSPPYINGMDYIINYKIELTWADFVDSYKALKSLKDRMVVCDNVSKSLLKGYAPVYQDKWLDAIEGKIQLRLKEKQNYRRQDMPQIIRKYFDDLLPVMQNVYNGLKSGARFFLVEGDSLMAGIYIPADLIIARMGNSVGFTVEDVMIARKRRSGQRHDFELRESVIVLRKGSPKP